MAVRSIRGRSARDGRYLAFPYNVFEFGRWQSSRTTACKRKVTNVAEVLAAKFREIYGRTKYAYAHWATFTASM